MVYTGTYNVALATDSTLVGQPPGSPWAFAVAGYNWTRPTFPGAPVWPPAGGGGGSAWGEARVAA